MAGRSLYRCLKVLKHAVVGWAQVTQYLGYSSLKDFFPSMQIRPNPGCINPLCGRAQAAHQATVNTPEARAAAAAAAALAAAEQEEAVVHEDNEWEIEVHVALTVS